MGTQPPIRRDQRPNLMLVPRPQPQFELDPDIPSDAQRIADAKRLARSTAAGREVIDRLEADGVTIELLPDPEFAERYGRLRAVHRREMAPRQTEHGVVQLSRTTVISLPWTTMLRPAEGALALVHQGTHHVLDQPAPGAPLSAAEREESARFVRDRVAAELGGRVATPLAGLATVRRAFADADDGE